MVKRVSRFVRNLAKYRQIGAASGNFMYLLIISFKLMSISGLILLVIASVTLVSCSRGMSVKQINSAVLSAQKTYNSSSKWQDRERAIKSVKPFETKRALELKMAATEDTHSKVRVQAVMGLAPFIRDDNVKDKLILMSQKDREIPVRYASLKTLANNPDISMYGLFEKYTYDTDWLFREIAYRGIMGITDEQMNEKSTALLIRGLSDSQETVQITILKSIKLQNDELYQSIRKNFFIKDYEKKITLLCATLKAVKGYNMDIRVRERVEQLILHQNKEVRVLALRALKSEPDYVNRNNKK